MSALGNCDNRHGAVIFLVALLMASILLESASAQAQAADPQKSTISGVVLNAVTRAPIARALVASGDNRYAMLTDSTGHFEFELIKPGAGTAADSAVWLNATRPGFLNEGEHGANATPGQDVTLLLTPESLIVGKVSLSTGEAPTGLTVQLYWRQAVDGLPRWTLRSASQPDSSGEFRFADLPPGAYKLLTNEMLDNDPAAAIVAGPLYGYPPAYYSGASDFSSASTIELAAGQTVQADLSLNRQPYYSVKIPVNGDNGSSGVTVDVSVHGHKGPGYSLGYSPGDHKIEGLLPNGTYVVTASSFGENTASGATNIKVAGAPLEAPALTLIPNSAISLNVKEEFTAQTQAGPTIYMGGGGLNRSGPGNFPPRGARLYLQASVETLDDLGQTVNVTMRPPLSPKDDSMVLEGVPPGRYWLRLHSNRGYVASATMGATDLLHQPLVVGHGATAPIDVTLRDDYATLEGNVSGIVEDPPAAAVWTTRAWVYCVPLPDAPGEFQQFGVSSEKMNFTVAPGGYRVLAFRHAQPNFPYRDQDAMRAYENLGQVIHVAAGQKANLQLQLITGDE